MTRHPIQDLIHAADQFVHEKNVKGLLDAGGELERHGAIAEAAKFLSIAGRIKQPSAFAEWDGSSLEGKSILIVQRIRHIAAPIRMARLIGAASLMAGRCVAIVPGRLVELFRRSFPDAEVYEQYDSKIGEFDFIASLETLTMHFAQDIAAFHATFRSLIPNKNLRNDFRSRYSRDGRKVVGISWHSTNSRKDIPSLTDFCNALTGAKHHFVSLQYGAIEQDIALLRSKSRIDLTFDAVNALNDLDSFAAQVAATDIVVSISNTTVHMAGSLGVPCIVCLDDNQHLIWPMTGQHTDWYPSVRILRKQGRCWDLVLREAISAMD